MREAPYRRTKGERGEYIVPEEYTKDQLRCKDCFSLNLVRSDKVAKGSKQVVVFCEDCEKMQYWKIAQWAAYNRRYNDNNE